MVNRGMSPNPVKAFTSHYIEIFGERMHYLDEGGAGKPILLLLHGNPTWCYLYRHLIASLSNYYRLIAPDHLGCGLSSMSGKRFRFGDRVNHLCEFVEKLGLTKFSLIMHDWGGPIGAGVALRNLTKLQKLVFFNTTLTEVDLLPKMIRFSAAPVIGKAITQYTTQFLRYTTELGVVNKLSEQDKAGYFWPYKTVKNRKAICDFVYDIPFKPSHPSYKDLTEIRSSISLLNSFKIKIIWGLKDPCFHANILEKIKEIFPKAEVHPFADASHLVIEDKRAEVIGLIDSFIGRTVESQLEAININDQLNFKQ
jgi:cis-3-alkyl-4-acyloxetan-2-one decarboxylase